MLPQMQNKLLSRKKKGSFMSEELEQDQSVIIWPTPIYHRKLSKTAQASIKSLMTPFIDDEIMDENAFHLSKQKSSIRNDKNATLPWDKYITHLRPHFYSFFESLKPNRNFEIEIGSTWINKYEIDNFQEVHDHAFKKVTFSCIYYFELPYQRYPAGKTFFLNRYGAETKYTDLNYIFDFFKDHERITLDTTTGSFVIFPAWLQHFTVPTKKPRITITTNISIRPTEPIEY
jgi:hypothetical protein